MNIVGPGWSVSSEALDAVRWRMQAIVDNLQTSSRLRKSALRLLAKLETGTGVRKGEQA